MLSNKLKKPVIKTPTLPAPKLPTYKPPVLKTGPTLPPPINEPMDLRKGNPTLPNDKPQSTLPAPAKPTQTIPAPTPPPLGNTGIVKPPVLSTPTLPPPVRDAIPQVPKPTLPLPAPVPPKPAPVVPVPPPPAPPVLRGTPPVVYNPPAPVPTKPPTAPGGIVAGEPMGPQKPTDPNAPQTRPTTGGVSPYDPAAPATPRDTSIPPVPKTPVPNPGPVKPPVLKGDTGPYNPPTPPPTGDLNGPTRKDPVPTIPTKGGQAPGPLGSDDPSKGGGVVKPNEKRDTNWVRRNETTQQRIDRLQRKLDGQRVKNPELQKRIDDLKKRLANGEVKPSDPSQDKNPTPTPGTGGVMRVQLDDDPDTWTPEMLAELAPARGTVTKFLDNANSSDKVKLGRRIDDLNDDYEDEGDGTPQGEEMKRTRQGETTQERITRLQAKLKGANPQKKKQLKERIAKLKARRDAGEDKPYEEKPKSKPIPTGEGDHSERIDTLKEKLKGATGDKKERIKARIAKLEAKDAVGGNNNNNTPSIAKGEPNGQQKSKPKPTSQVPTKPPTQQERNETRQNEDLEERLKRLKDKFKANPKNEKLKQRIADLEARIRAGDVKGSSVKNQPGTPDRPYRNRGVTYKPFGYGGTLRI